MRVVSEDVVRERVELQICTQVPNIIMCMSSVHALCLEEQFTFLLQFFLQTVYLHVKINILHTQITVVA